jgi:hypothetical protein
MLKMVRSDGPLAALIDLIRKPKKPHMLVAFSIAALVLVFDVSIADVWAAPATTSAIDRAARGLFRDDPEGDYICSSAMLARNPSRCPSYGPGTRAMRLDFLRAHLPDPLPELAVEELEQSEDAITPYSFAYVRPLPAATYGHPEEAAAGLPPLREFSAGDNWVSVVGSVSSSVVSILPSRIPRPSEVSSSVSNHSTHSLGSIGTRGRPASPVERSATTLCYHGMTA